MSLDWHAVFTAGFEAVFHDRVHDSLRNAEPFVICPQDRNVLDETFGVDSCLEDHNSLPSRENCSAGPCDRRFF